MTWRRFYAFFRFAGVKGQAGELAAGASFLPQFDSFLTLAGGRLTFKSLTRLNTTYDTLRSVSRTGDALRGREARQTSAQPYAGDTPAREIVDIVDGHFVVEDSPAAPSRVDSVNTGSYNGDSNLRLRNITATEASGSPVTISAAPLKSAENGRVVLNTTSGAVDMNSVSFENPVVPLLYQYAAQEYGTATGNAFLSGYESAKGQNAGLDIAEYKSAFDRIAESSRQGMQEDSLRKRYAGEIDQIGDVAFLYAEAAGQTIKNAGESSIYVGREENPESGANRQGVLWNRSEHALERTNRRTESTDKQSSPRVQRTSQEDDARGKIGRGFEKLRRVGSGEYSYTETKKAAKTARSKALQAEFDELGIESTVIDGKAEVTRNGVKSILGGEATTIADGSVLVRNDGESTAPTRRISGHEFFHVAEKKGAAQEFRNATTEENLSFDSHTLALVADDIGNTYGADFSIIENPQKFYNEFCAFVSGDIFENDGHLSEKFSEMFRDPATVEAAWADMRAQFKGENAANKRFGLGEYSDQRKNSILSNKNNVILNDKQHLHRLIDESLQNTQSKKSLHFGVVPASVLQRIQDACPNLPPSMRGSLFDLNHEYSLEIGQEDIRHLSANKRSVSKQDVIDFVDKLPEIVANFDSVNFTVYTRGQNNMKGLRFSKTFPDGKYISMEIVSNKKHLLAAHNIFMEKSDYTKKKSLEHTLSVQSNAQDQTSETQGAQNSFKIESSNGSMSDTNIAQKSASVNTQYMQGSEKNAKSSIADFSTDEEIRALLEKYGALPRGEKAVVDVEVPAKTSDNKKVMRFTRTLLESGTITDDLADTIKQGVLTEALSYTPYGDEKAISYANNTIKNQGVEYAKDEWASVANGNGQVTKGKVAIGERLLQMAAKDGDKAAVMKYAAEMAEVGTRLGQSVQAYSLLKKMGGAGELVYIKRAVDRLNNQFLKKNSNKPAPI